MININSWECGKGKTTKWINKIIIGSDRVLLVVPSIELQHQYAKTFPNIRFINNQNSTSVVKEAYELLNNNNKFVCITSQAFIRMHLDYTIKSRYTLIIDEAFDPIRKFSIDSTKAYNLPDFKFRDKLTITGNLDWVFNELTSNDRLTYTDWSNISVDNSYAGSIMEESKTWRMLTDMNYKTYMRISEYEKLCINAKDKCIVIQMLNECILTDWNIVYIASAKFESTFMYFWIKQTGIKYNISKTLQFTPHDSPITLHAPPKLKWSKTRNLKDPNVLDQYHNYVNSIADSNVLSIRNNNELRTLTNDVNVNHNVHGMNNKSHITNVSLESALNPDSQLYSFYKTFLEMDQNKYDTEIKDAFCAHLFYQVIMRTAIRNNESINVFLLDTDIACVLTSYFFNISVREIEIVTANSNKPGRPKLSKQQIKDNKREYMKQYMRCKRNVSF